MNVRIVVICSNELERIIVDGIEMDDISPIRHKPIQDWFVPSNGRDGWEGLIQEIKRNIDDSETKLSFEFQGPKESKDIFERLIREYGYGVDELSDDEIAKIHLEDARKAEHRGLYKKALQHYEKAAEFGKSAEASFCVAEYYFNFEEKGIECSKEDALSNAIDYYEKSASAGYAKAQYKLYKILATDEYVKKDRVTALKWLKKVAESGDDKAQVDLGNELYDKDCKEALKWYLKAVENNNAEGQWRLGWLYESGKLGKADYVNAEKWYKKAAENNNAEGQWRLGVLYASGNLGKVDYVNAEKWWKKAAENDNAEGQWKLGWLYESGKLGKADYVNAEKWYKKAAENNNAEGQWRLGVLYASGNLGKVDYVNAEKWWKKAAENDNAEGQWRLGWLYKRGYLGKADYVSAEKWYKKAAENNNSNGQLGLGLLYECIEKDYTKAIEWYNKAIKNNDVESMFFLGRCYELGTGVKKDLEVAFQWYKKGADAQNPDADCCFKIAESYYVQINPKGVLKTGVMLAASVLIPVTNFVTIPTAILGAGVATVMKYDKFVKTDAGKDMMKYYRRAANLGHSKAKERVKELETYEK